MSDGKTTKDCLCFTSCLYRLLSIKSFTSLINIFKYEIVSFLYATKSDKTIFLPSSAKLISPCAKLFLLFFINCNFGQVAEWVYPILAISLLFLKNPSFQTVLITTLLKQIQSYYSQNNQ